MGLHEFLNKDYLWYDPDVASTEDIPGVITALMEELDQQVGSRELHNLLYLRMYSNSAIRGLSADSYSDTGLISPKLAWNVVQSCIDTAAANIATQRPKPKFITSGGCYKDKKKAEQLTDFVAGQFYLTDTYTKTRQAFKDACIFGTGFVKIYVEDGEVQLERVFPNEIVVDDIDAKYGCPRSLYQLKEVPTDVLGDLYPEHKDQIHESGQFRDSHGLKIGGRDTVGVVEAWHLPTGDTPGRHVITTTNVTLLDEEWEDEEFPFAVFRWNPQSLGYWGQGIANMLEGIQYMVNDTLLKIQRLMRLASSKVFVRKGTKVNYDALNNEDWGVIEYGGDRPPEWKTIQAFSPDYASFLEVLYARAFEIVGISQLAAQSKKPEGLNSGKAIREYSDIQTQRFMEVGQAWEQFHLDIAKQFIKLAKRIDEDGDGDYKVTTDAGDQLEEIKWKDVRLEEDAYVMRAWPVPVLTGSPAYQLQTILDVGQIDPQLQQALLPHLEHPDVKAFLDRQNAYQNVVDLIISNMLEGKDYPPPEPMMHLQFSLHQMRLAYMEYTAKGEDEEILQRFRDWIAQGQQLLQPPVPPPQVPPAGPEGPAMADPTATAGMSANPATGPMPPTNLPG